MLLTMADGVTEHREDEPELHDHGPPRVQRLMGTSRPTRVPPARQNVVVVVRRLSPFEPLPKRLRRFFERERFEAFRVAALESRSGPVNANKLRYLPIHGGSRDSVTDGARPAPEDDEP